MKILRNKNLVMMLTVCLLFALKFYDFTVLEILTTSNLYRIARKVGPKGIQLARLLNLDHKDIRNVQEENSVYTQDLDFAFSVLEVYFFRLLKIMS